MVRPLPNWLRLWFQGALITEVYPEIRAIAVGYSETHELTVRYYLDRDPTEYDFDSLHMVVGEVLSNTSQAEQITSVVEECVYSSKKMAKIDRLDGLVYGRREYIF